MSDWLPYVIGYAFATVAAHFPIAWLVDRLWNSIGGQAKHWERRSGWWLPGIVGLVERALYVGSINLGAHEFVGVWLALKVATHWGAWKEGIKEGNRVLSGHSIASIFLIGNGVSIGYAIVGYFLISEVRRSVAASIAVVLVILGATVCLGLIAKGYGEKVKKDAA
jgi:hypothetical protein